jgi:hypothetical protein
MKLVVWDRLAVDDNSTDKYWFSFNKIKVKRQLKFEWAVQPVLMEAQILPSNGNIVRRFRMLFSSGFLNFPYIAGSMGINDVEEEGVPVTIENTADNPVPMIDATP